MTQHYKLRMTRTLQCTRKENKHKRGRQV